MNIPDYLTAHSLSQEAFGKRVGVTQSRVSQWIAGEPIPPERAELIEIDTAGEIRVEEICSEVTWQRDPDGKILGHFKPSAVA